MTRLRRDVRGNTLAIMAAAMIPLIGLVGSGVDLARLYIVKTRLQHACDAGALAGRKTMGGGTWTQSINGVSNYPQVAAVKFFDANIKAGAFGATNITRTFSESAGKVTGTATGTVDMTLMRVLGEPSRTLTVTCDAEMRLPNTDVMFVLDTTGSMSSKAVSSDTDTKIESLRTSVKCFYEIVARLDTDANCSTGTPSGGTGTQVQIRFGFVPYATNVNVGKLLPTAYMADDWTYQSRQAKYTTTTSTSWSDPVDSTGPTGSTQGDWSNWGNSYNDSTNSSGGCDTPASTQNGPSNQQPYDTTPVINGNTKIWYTRYPTGTVYTQYQATKKYFLFFAYCQIESRTRTDANYTSVQHTSTRTTTTNYTFDKWHYGPVSIDVSGLKNGTSWNSSLQVPIGTDGTNRTISWDGCIEERKTVKQSSYDPIPSGANDLNIDMAPTSGDQDSLWGPALPGVIYMRGASTNSYSTSTSNWYYDPFDSSSDYKSGPSYSCPSPAKKLQTWPNATDFDDYVDDLSVGGNTYHDIGLLWGARLMSPTGIFSSENAYTPQGGEIERHLIFMTDGDTNAINTDYAAYGLPWFDRRQTSASSAPSNSDLNDQVNARFLALCTAVKNKNITLWVISFGSGSNSTTEKRLEKCATSGRYFTARNSAQLQQTFATIADQISQLRLTK